MMTKKIESKSLPREKVEEIISAVLKKLLSSGEWVYILPVMRVEHEGREYLQTTDGLLKTMGAQMNRERLNYWRISR